MATYLGPQDSTNMPQAQWQEMFGGMWSSGVLAGQLNSYVVTTTSGLGISVASGKAMIQGFLARSDAAVALTAAAADPTNPRIDRAVLHADLSAHTLTVQLLTGTPAPSPTPPALTQTSTVWEIALYQVRVNAASATITSLTDERTFSAPNIPASAITSSMIANGAVGTSDIAAGAITDGLMANQKVNRSGDTMTGQLRMQNNYVLVQQDTTSSNQAVFTAQDTKAGGKEYVWFLMQDGSLVIQEISSGKFVLQVWPDGHANFVGAIEQNGNPVVLTGPGNLASTPLELIVVGPSSANLPAAGVKGRIAIVVPFALP